MKLLAPGFAIAQPQPLRSFVERTSECKISLSLSLSNPGFQINVH